MREDGSVILVPAASATTNTPAEPTTPTTPSSASATKQQQQQQQQSQRGGMFRTLSGTRLNTLNHQVAGQAPLLKFADGKVCKPLIDTERDYYEHAIKNADPEFLKFHPAYYGCCSITTSADDAGEDDEDNMLAAVNRVNLSTSHWLEKFAKNVPTNKPTHIILEDLTQSYKHPCVLDLKMGIRQHGKDASLAKIKKLKAKCAATTSSSLGYRICGLKVYQVANNQYIFKDKYYGRKLTTSTIQEAFSQFFDNGVRMRTELLKLFIRRLQTLLSIMEKQTDYRFYGSSLLFIYEGACSENQEVKFDLRMVDFAHTYHIDEIKKSRQQREQQQQQQHQQQQQTSSSTAASAFAAITSKLKIGSQQQQQQAPQQQQQQHDEDDDGYVFGLRNLLKLLMQLSKLASSAYGITI